MKRTISILAIVILIAALAVTSLQVSAKGGGPDNHGGQGNGQGNGQSNENPGNHDNNDQHGNQGNRPTQESNRPEHAKKLNFKGVIAAVDVAGMTLTLKDGNTAVFTFDAATRFRIPTLNSSATAADLKVGMQVSVQARLTDTNTLLALKVSVIPGKPTRVHRVGQVTEYIPGTSITILAKDGQTYTFKLAETVKILPDGLADTLSVGSWVTIIAPRDVTQLEWIAVGIVIHPHAPGTETPETPTVTLTPTVTFTPTMTFTPSPTPTETATPTLTPTP